MAGAERQSDGQGAKDYYRRMRLLEKKSIHRPPAEAKPQVIRLTHKSNNNYDEKEGR